MKASSYDDRGFVHAFRAGSTVDGPGTRFVLWMSGCVFRCLYCQNPDTWKMKHGRPVMLSFVLREIDAYTRHVSSDPGGITVSGGEPLVQAPFVARIFRECKARGLHTALDTNGFLGERLSDADLESVDLVMLDVKSYDPQTHLRVTGLQVDPVLRFAERLSALGIPAWIRFVLVPGLTDDPANVAGLARHIATLRNVERTEVIPFHQAGAAKWEQMGRDYELAATPPPTSEQLQKTVATFERMGVAVW